MRSSFTPANDAASKVPHVTLAFWLIKICATTVGETGGDALSMTLHLGYAVSTLIFLACFAVTLALQVGATRYRPFVYWAVVVATTTVGTTLSDYLDRTVGLGYVASSLFLSAGVVAVLLLWRRTTGAIQFEDIVDRQDEIFYWITILVANTLGTALGDFVATTAGIGFEYGALVFAGAIGLVVAAHYLTGIRDSALFWAAYVLTRPLGATLGDTLTKPRAEGGLALGRISASLAIVALMLLGILLTMAQSNADTAPAIPPTGEGRS